MGVSRGPIEEYCISKYVVRLRPSSGVLESSLVRGWSWLPINEHNAQFAKETVACQSLDNDEIFNVRTPLSKFPKNEDWRKSARKLPKPGWIQS